MAITIHKEKAVAAKSSRLKMVKDAGDVVTYQFPVKKLKINDDLEIAYTDEGPAKAEILLFIHGLGAGIPMWDKTIPALTKTYRCLALDLPGHSLSTKGDFPYSIAFFTDVVFALMDKLSLKKVTLVGHSIGGHVAVAMALKKPELVERLVLAAPAGLEPYTSMDKQTIIGITRCMLNPGNVFFQHRMNYLIGFSNDAVLAAELGGKMAYFRHDASVFTQVLRNAITGTMLESVDRKLHLLTQPCLVVTGGDDRVMPYQFFHAEKYHRVIERQTNKIRKSTFVQIPGAGHFLPYQRPEEFNQELLEFLQEEKV